MEGDCSVNYGLDGGNIAGATLIGSIAETNTCRITRLARSLHIHTSGGSTVDKEEEKKKRRRRRRRRRKEEKGRATAAKEREKWDEKKEERDRDKSVLSLISD